MVETYPDASPLIEIMENTDNLSEEKSEELISRLEEEVGIIFESDYGGYVENESSWLFIL